MGRLATVVGLVALLMPSAVSSAAAEGTPLPVGLTFSTDAGGVRDRAGVGTGFTFVLSAPASDSYKPTLLDVDRTAGLLRLSTTAGLAYKKLNNLDNALGFQLANAGEAVTLHASLADIRALDQTGTYQQAGLWVGPSQDTYVKLVVISGRRGQSVHMLYESAGAVVESLYGPALQLTGRAVDLRLRVAPQSGVLAAAYSLDGGAAVRLGEMTFAPSLLASTGFSAGIFGSYRLASEPNRFDFDAFGAVCSTEDCSAVPEPDPELGDGNPSVGQPGGPDGEEPPVATPLGDGNPSVGQPGGPDGEEPPVATPPPTVNPSKLTASLRVRRRLSVRGLRRGMRVAVRCTLSCGYKLRMQVPAPAARRLGLTRKLAAVSVSRKAGDALAGRRARTVLRLGRRYRRLLSVDSRVALKLRLVASAGANGSVKRKRTVVLRP